MSVKLEINNGFKVAKPFLNKLLASKPLNFPKNVFGLFELTAMTLSYYDDYIYAGITPIFIGPESVYEPVDEVYDIEIVYDYFDEDFEDLIQ